MSIEQRMAEAMIDVDAQSVREGIGELTYSDLARAVLAACPVIAALDHAREGWLYEGESGIGWLAQSWQAPPYQTRVLVIDAPESS